MLKKAGKSRSFTLQILGKLSLLLFLVHVLFLCSIGFLVTKMVQTKEQQAVTEGLERLTAEIEAEFRTMEVALRGLSQQNTVINYLESLESVGKALDEANPSLHVSNSAQFMTTVAGYDEVKTQLESLEAVFGQDNVAVSLFSRYTEHEINSQHTGLSNDVSLSNFEASLEENGLYVSDIFSDETLGENIITVVYPVKQGTGEVLGSVSLYLSVEQLPDFLSSISFADSYLLDQKNQILLHPQEELLLSSLEELNYRGDEWLQELKTPTGSIVLFQENAVKRMGGVSIVPSTDWKLVSAMNIWEYQKEVLGILCVVNGIQLVVFGMMLLLVRQYLREKRGSLLQNYLWEISQEEEDISFDQDSLEEVRDLLEEMQDMVDSYLEDDEDEEYDDDEVEDDDEEVENDDDEVEDDDDEVEDDEDEVEDDEIVER